MPSSVAYKEVFDHRFGALELRDEHLPRGRAWASRRTLSRAVDAIADRFPQYDHRAPLSRLHEILGLGRRPLCLDGLAFGPVVPACLSCHVAPLVERSPRKNIPVWELVGDPRPSKCGTRWILFWRT